MSECVKFEKGSIWIHGKKTQIISGVIHYFRLPRAYWRDRLEKVVCMGCNCIETYIFWNLTEPEEGEYYLEDNNDFEAFFRLAAEFGLYVIVRPGPYTCSECDNGGLPYWLMNKSGMEVRRTNKPFLDAVEKYWNMLIPKIASLQIDNGGPVIAMQIENEYGGYCHDRRYLETLAGYAHKKGITVPLFTSDGDGIQYIRSGMIPGAFMAMNFGVNAMQAFLAGTTIRPDDPLFCAEFWGSWFDHWGDKYHITRNPEEQASELDDMLRMGGNVNIYMACGGTNFGFMNGANYMPEESRYRPTATTYDFDAPISESGEITAKFYALQKVIRKYRPEVKETAPENPIKKAYGKIDFTGTALLFDNLDELSTPVRSVSPQTMEQLGQSGGFVLYRTKIMEMSRNTVTLETVRDRVQIFLNRKPIGVFDRNDSCFTTESQDFPENSTLDILVENLGRINYGPYVGRDPKGIVGCVMIGKQIRLNYEQYPLPLKSLNRLRFRKFDSQTDLPAFHRAEFSVEGKPCDTFLKFPGVKGSFFINGFNLGRYWNIGPNRTVYVPGCLLKEGKNEIIVFETTSLRFPYLEFTDKMDFGPCGEFLDSLDQF